MKTKILNYSKITTIIFTVFLIALCAVCGCSQQTNNKSIGVA